MAAPAKAAAEARALFRAFLREGAKYPNYNIREYVWRKARAEFRAAPEALAALQLPERLEHTRAQLGLVKRQALVYGLYGRKFKSIMDLPMEQVLQEQAAIVGSTAGEKVS